MTNATYSLRSALLLFILLPLLAMSIIAGGYSLHRLEQRTKARRQEDIALIARAISVPLGHALARHDSQDMARLLRSAFEIGRVYGAYVFDADGHLIAASGPTSPTGRSEAARLASHGTRQGHFARFDGKPLFTYFVPLTDSGRRIDGLLEITRRGSGFEGFLQRTRYEALAILLALALLLSVIVLYGHHHAIGSHVEAVLRSLSRVAQGDREHRVAGRGPRELRMLAVGINEMLDSLAGHETRLTQQRASQAALKERLRQSEKLAAIGRLASGVAHELGSPLNVVDGKAQKALRHPLADSVRAALADIRREVSRMGVTVRQLMDFGRNNPLRFAPEDTGHLVRRVHEKLRAELQERGLEFAAQADIAPPEVLVDRLRIEQALTNLLQNALQAARGQVRMGWFETPTARGFTVEDDGPGVDDAVRAHIFEPFFTTKPVNEGTGLGLAVAYAAVEDHGGYIEVDRSPGLGGARFRIFLQNPKECHARD